MRVKKYDTSIYICTNNYEKIFYSEYEYLILDKKIELTNIIGNSICKLLNATKDLINLGDTIKNDIPKSKPINKKDIPQILSNFQKVLEDVCSLFFIERFNIKKIETNLLKYESEYIPFETYANELINFIEKIFTQLYYLEDFIEEISSNGNVSYMNEYQMPECDISFIDDTKTDLSIIQEKYHIKSITDLISVSIYKFIKNNIYIKHCKNCNKYFVTTRGQTRYCNNISPTDPTKTCKEVKKFISQDSEMEYWECELDELEKKYATIRQFFNDHINKCTNKKQRDKLEKSKEKFLKYGKILKRYTKGATENTRTKYLIEYKNFVNTVYNDQHLSLKDIKIVKPKYID